MRRTGATRLSEVIRLLGAAHATTGADGAMCIPLWCVCSGDLLIQEGSACDAVHVVRSGSFKCFKTSEDSYEQVLSFASAGEVIGFEAVSGSCHRASAAALEDAMAYRLPPRDLDF